MRMLLICALSLAAPALEAKGIGCPTGTTPRGEATPEISEAWCEDANAKMHGPYKSWWPNGKLGNEGQYERGKATGKWRGWYESGELQGEEWFEDGVKMKAVYYDRQGHKKPSR